MSFKKLFIHNKSELLGLPEPWKYYIAKPILRQITEVSDDHDQLVGKDKIDAAGLVYLPFWNDKADAIDSEGRAFLEYLSKNPDFEIKIRRGVLERLTLANRSLPKGFKIAIKAGYRPVSVQQSVFNTELATAQQTNPDWSQQQAYEYVSQYVSDPSIDVSPHTTGAAVDIILVDEQMKIIDMGSPVNALGDASWAAFDEISHQAIKNRSTLRNAMLDAGFAPLASEWWHFSYGDQRWAVYYNKKQAKYGTITEQKR